MASTVRTDLIYNHVSQAELTGYWTLGEATGNRASRIGNSVFNSAGYVGPTLTESGTVAQWTNRGPSGTWKGALFAGNDANYLSCSPSMSTSKGLTLSFVVKPTTVGVDQIIVSQYNNSSNGRFLVRLTSSNTVEFLVLNSAGTLVGVESDETLSVNTEYTIRVWVEERLATPGTWDTAIQINGNVVKAGANFTGNWGLGTSTFMVGRVQTSGATEPFNGGIAELHLFNRPVTRSERAILYRAHRTRENVHEAIPAGPTNIRARAMRGKPLLWGVAFDEEAGTNIVTRSRVESDSAGYGNVPNLLQVYRSGPNPITSASETLADKEDGSWEFREEGLKAALSVGAAPMLTLEPFYFQAGTGTRLFHTMEEFISGAIDEWLLEQCNQLRRLGSPVIVRFMHEMDLRTAYSWVEQTQASDDSVTPPRWLTAWKYAVRFFREELSADGSTDYQNVWFNWCCNRNPLPQLGTAPWNDIVNYWPGAAWVDTIGQDGYDSPAGFSFPEYNPTPLSFIDAQAPNFAKLQAFADVEDKLFILGEFNTRGRTESEWQDWVEEASRQALRNGIDILCIFDVPAKEWEVFDNIFSTLNTNFTPNSLLGPLK